MTWLLFGDWLEAVCEEVDYMYNHQLVSFIQKAVTGSEPINAATMTTTTNTAHVSIRAYG